MDRHASGSRRILADYELLASTGVLAWCGIACFEEGRAPFLQVVHGDERFCLCVDLANVQVCKGLIDPTWT